MTDPFVLLGLARTRRPWFSELSRWATAGSAPIEFIKCLTAEEARAVLGSGRRLSALVVDSSTPGLDRDLVATARAQQAPTFVVSDGRLHRDWDSLGCAAVLHQDFASDELVDLLERHAAPVERGTRVTAHARIEAEPARSLLVGVTGAGGTGASTVAMSLAQALAREVDAGSVALVDGARRADLAMYHDVGDVIPGLPELVEAHRIDHPDPDDVRSLLFQIEDRRYDLLLGMRGPRDWVTMRPHSLRAALEGLERSYDMVVVDHDPDLEGEDATGSVGVEDRHGIARAVTQRADLVLVVGRPGVKGISDLASLTRSIAEEGVPAERILPVVNQCRRSPAERAGITRTLARLTGDFTGAVVPPLFLGRIRSVEPAHRSAARLPEPMCRPLGRAVRRLLLGLGSRSRTAPVGVPIRAGELGTDVDELLVWPPHEHGRDVA